MDESDIQQIVEQRKENYDMKQMDKEFMATIPDRKNKD